MKTFSLISIGILLCATISCTPMDSPIRRDDFSYPERTTGPKPIASLSNSPDCTNTLNEVIPTQRDDSNLSEETGN